MNAPSSYRGPADIWKVSAEIKFDMPLDAADPRYVDLSSGRPPGYRLLYRALGIDPETRQLMGKHSHRYTLFFGHRGCGKSTELRRIAADLRGADRFCVVFLDILAELDPNNLRYPDVCLALARRLLAELEESKISSMPPSSPAWKIGSRSAC